MHTQSGNDNLNSFFFVLIVVKSFEGGWGIPVLEIAWACFGHLSHSNAFAALKICKFVCSK